jgi:putative acetyltransferase
VEGAGTPIMVTIRSEEPADLEGIHSIHQSAFPTEAEARLVDRLREDRKLALSLIAEVTDGVVGHIAFSPVSVEPKTPAIQGLGLGPVAVLPEWQGIGIGEMLITGGIEECRRGGYSFIVVLGEPEYYQRFGFRRASLFGLGNEYGVDDPFMVLELRLDGLPKVPGTVRYVKVFSEVTDG